MTNRREFITGGALGFAAAGVGRTWAADRPKAAAMTRACTTHGNLFRIACDAVKEPVKFFIAGDTHLGLEDDRGEPYRKYSARMSRYSQKKMDVFASTLAKAKELGADFFGHVGDLVSFPAEKSVELAAQALKDSGLNWLYTAGNHDWRYEGIGGEPEALRREWTERVLKPLYPAGSDPLCQERVVKGVRFLGIDDSTNFVTSDQLEWFRAKVATGDPLVLLLHIPLWAPGISAPDFMVPGMKVPDDYEFCGVPGKTPAKHAAATDAFVREAFAAPNVLAVFAGHNHAYMNFVPSAGPVEAQVACNWSLDFLYGSICPSRREGVRQ